MNKFYLIIEIIWIIIGTASVAAAIRVAVTTGGIRILLFVAMAVISFLFAWYRHSQRKKS